MPPEDCLRRATNADSSLARAKYATCGLAHPGTDRTLRAMLLRQLYLSHMEGERFEEAVEVARAACGLAVLSDVACQDLARAYLGAGEVGRAVQELRRASRLAPASRRSFHLWTLGGVLFFQRDFEQAARVFERAFRWGTTARPLYRAQLELARLELGTESADLLQLRDHLQAAACGQGYGRFVLGELALRLGDPASAEQYFAEFVEKSESGRTALRVGLRSELTRARAALRRLAEDGE